MIAGEGDDLPVSAMPARRHLPHRHHPVGKAQHRAGDSGWDEELCIQCGKCVLVCPHAVIRAKVYEPAHAEGAPATFKSVPARWKDFKSMQYTLQVAPEDCTGCALCVEVCPAKSKSEVKHKAINMVPQAPLREPEAANWEFFLKLPEIDRQPAQPGTGQRQRSCCSRCSSSRAPARAAAKRLTSSC